MIVIKNTIIDIHVTDLSFSKKCLELYGVNKGVLNTIDLYFYENGYRNIIERRKMIISFLEFSSHGQNKNYKLKFGHGGLVSKIHDFLTRNSQITQI